MFAASADFALTKPAGTPCPNLQPDCGGTVGPLLQQASAVARAGLPACTRSHVRADLVAVRWRGTARSDAATRLPTGLERPQRWTGPLASGPSPRG